MDRIHLNILTPGGDKWERQVSSVRLPTEFGSLGILSGHATMLCAVKKGEVICRFGEDGRLRIAIGDGIASVADNELTLLVSELEQVE